MRRKVPHVRGTYSLPGFTSGIEPRTGLLTENLSDGTSRKTSRGWSHAAGCRLFFRTVGFVALSDPFQTFARATSNEGIRFF